MALFVSVDWTKMFSSSLRMRQELKRQLFVFLQTWAHVIFPLGLAYTLQFLWSVKETDLLIGSSQDNSISCCPNPSFTLKITHTLPTRYTSSILHIQTFLETKKLLIGSAQDNSISCFPNTSFTFKIIHTLPTPHPHIYTHTYTHFTNTSHTCQPHLIHTSLILHIRTSITPNGLHAIYM